MSSANTPAKAKDYGLDCSVARSLEYIGERWTMLILRDAFLGVRRFDDFQVSLGIARNILTKRLGGLVEAGILERARYQDNPPRHEYRLTEKGLDLHHVVVALMAWGDKWESAEPPRRLIHKECGNVMHAVPSCSECGQSFGPRDVRVDPEHNIDELRSRRLDRAG